MASQKEKRMTNFTVVPLQEVPGLTLEPARLQAQGDRERSHARARILSISYDAVLLRTRQMLLERSGYEVASASSREQALRLCRERRFDLVVLGYTIPHGDKDAIIRELRLVCDTPLLSITNPAERRGATLTEYAFQNIDGPEAFLEMVERIVTGVANRRSTDRRSSGA
jgi:DNA-binding response OmpR family regulator